MVLASCATKSGTQTMSLEASFLFLLTLPLSLYILIFFQHECISSMWLGKIATHTSSWLDLSGKRAFLS